MSRANEIYFVELQARDGDWLRVNLHPATRSWCDGWMDCYASMAGPLLAARVRRQWSEEIVNSASAKTETSLGMSPGSPTAAQYRAAGERATSRALAMADAIDAYEAMAVPTRQVCKPGER